MSSAIELHALPALSGEPLPGASDLNATASSKDGISGSPSAQALAGLPPRPKEQVFRERVQLFALYWWCVSTSFSSAGPLIPRIQKVYHVNFAIVSLIFVFACVGFIGGAMINVPLTDRFGFGKFLCTHSFNLLPGSLCQIVAYTMQSPAPPFPVFVLSFVINGVGIAIQDAQANGYIASLRRNSETKMGLLHGAYGAGALVAPIVATQFSQLDRWSFHYLASLGVAISNTIVLALVFRGKGQDELLISVGEAAGETSTSEHSTFRQILSTKTVHLLAFFILVYVGVEVTIGGPQWIVTYIIDVRGGGPSSGYVSAGFFGGLMTGRIALLWLNQKIGERRVLYIYSILAIALEVVVWRVPSLIGDAVAVSIVGVLLGPIYPIVMNYAGRVIPRWILTGSIGWIAGFGQAGSAVFPFITGAIASKTGIKALQPLLISMMSFMLLLWAFVPSAPRRVD
ncbi:major facilitator superfamily domain-containing protein [Mycena filopes]|nr:major facilitator superfamily domain-containing protein [Mycena filopes]